MRERPILMSGPMVRALLEGRKTQTRRIVKPQPHEDCGAIEVGRYHPTVVDRHGDEQPGAEIFGAYSLDGDWGAKCPYGAPGDRLWVREAWIEYDKTGYVVDPTQGRFVYRADCAPGTFASDGIWWKWKSSIHMPRWASRLTLTLTDVRVERVQDISEAEAEAEGFASRSDFLDTFYELNKKAPNPMMLNWAWALTFTVNTPED